MSKFVELTDYDASIHRDILDALVREDETVIEVCEDRAIAEMRCYLSKRYDCNKILAYLGKFLRVVDAEDVIDRHIDDHHQHELVPVVPCGRKNLVAVVAFAQITPHFGNGPVLANLNDRFVFAHQCVKNVAVDTRIVIGEFYKFAHSPNILELS